MHSRGKKSQREIARTTGLSRNTVSKWLRGPLGDEPKYERDQQPSKLTAFHETIRQALEQPERRVALITPDRGLAGRVIAQLKRWGIAKTFLVSLSAVSEKSVP